MGMNAVSWKYVLFVNKKISSARTYAVKYILIEY